MLSKRLGPHAGLRQHNTDVIVAPREVCTELGDAGILVRQLPPDCKRTTVRRQCESRLAGLRKQDADGIVAVRQPGAVADDGGVVVSPLRQNRQRRRYDSGRLDRFADLRQQKANVEIAVRHGSLHGAVRRVVVG